MPRSAPRLTFALLFAAAAAHLTAPPASATAWSRTYGGTGADEARSVRPTTDGGFIVAGVTGSFGSGGQDAWVLKLDFLGNVQWERTYGGSQNDDARSVFQTSDGGYVVAGYTESFGVGGGGNGDAWVFKLDGSGNVQWEKAFGSTCIDKAAAVQQTSSGGYIVAGATCSFGFGTSGDAWVLNLDGSGNVIWENTYGSNGWEEALSVHEIAGGGFIVAGHTDVHNPNVDNDFWLLRLDALGMAQWQWRAGGSVSGLSGDSAHSVQQTADGGFVVAGTTVLGAGQWDFWIVKTDGQGFLQWQKTFGFVLTLDSGQGIHQTADGGYVVAGYRAVVGSLIALLVRLDGSGNLVWQKAYSPGTLDRLDAVRATPDGGFVAAGYTDPTGSGNTDLWVLKTDANGDVSYACGVGATASGSFAASGVPTNPTSAIPSPSAATTSNTSLTAISPVPAVAQQCPIDRRANQDAGTDAQQETALALDPNGSLRQVVAYMDDPDPNTFPPVRFPSLGVSFTSDGGATWTDRQIRLGCDGADNDLDGPIDEETLCDGLDDDLDARVDEDTCCNLMHVDPSVASDQQGNFTAAYLARDPNAPTFGGSSFVAAVRSTDGGATWTQLPIAASSPFGPDVNPMDGFPDPAPFLDRPRLVVDANPQSPQAGAAYAAWQVDSPVTPANTKVVLASLASGGGAWSGPVQVNDVPPNECDGFDLDFDGRIDEELCNGLDDDLDALTDEDLCCQCAERPAPGVAGGDLWVIWRRNAALCGPPGRFLVDVSLDAGQTFNGHGGDLPGPAYAQIPAVLRNHSFTILDAPALAVDPLNPVVLYAAFAEDPPGPDESDVMFTKSLDGGFSWETPVRVNDDGTNTPQYVPAITAKTNANFWTLVDVVWYDERHSIGCDGISNDLDPLVDEERPNGIDDDGDALIDEDVCDPMIDVYASRSANTPGIPSVFRPSLRVTDVSFPPPASPWPGFLGDYLAAASDRYRTFAAWADVRNGDNDVYTDVILDLDADGDGRLDGTDCLPPGPSTWARPGVVQGVALTPVPASTNVTVSWTSQDPSAGPSTRYDVVSGLLSRLTLDTDYRSSICLVDDHPDTPYTDTRPNPPPGDGYYFVLRAVNTCGTGTYGQTGPADPRTGLEDGAASLPSPDPCP